MSPLVISVFWYYRGLLHAIEGNDSMVAGDASILSTQHVNIKICFRTREMAQCLKALVALLEEDLLPSTHMAAHDCVKPQFQGI